MRNWTYPLFMAFALSAFAMGADSNGQAAAPLRIGSEPLCPGTISPFQHGQFIEYLCDLVPSMWAEKLYDTSFEGLQPYGFVYLRETDFKEKPWYPSGATNRSHCTRDKSTKVSGEVSMKIDVPAGPPATVGISQDGLAVSDLDPCNLSCWLRQQNLSGPITVKIHRAGQVLASCEFKPTGQWEKFKANLDFKAAATDATITISFRGRDTWLDNISLMPKSRGRLAGGCGRGGARSPSGHHPLRRLHRRRYRLRRFRVAQHHRRPDRRKPFTAWGGLQESGAGLEEIVQFCQLVGAEPLLCVRITERKPEDAAAEVEYFNGPADSPMGAMRAKNGHPQPYKVKYWQVGNERGGRDYERVLPEFCKAMKKADPNIKLLSSVSVQGGSARGVRASRLRLPAPLLGRFRLDVAKSGRDSQFDSAVRRRQADQSRHHRVEQHRRRPGTGAGHALGLAERAVRSSLP